MVVGGFGVDDRNAALNSVLLGTEEGVSWVHWQDGAWRIDRLGTGEETEVGFTGFKGTGNLAIGRVGGDPYAYIATLEPFHGNVVAVYTKGPGGKGLKGPWRRTILDVFGDPNEAGEGAGHHVMTADFDGDGDDEFLMALRGPWPWQGVFYYKCIDVENAVFVKKRVSTAWPRASRSATSTATVASILRPPGTTRRVISCAISRACSCSSTRIKPQSG